MLELRILVVITRIKSCYIGLSSREHLVYNFKWFTELEPAKLENIIIHLLQEENQKSAFMTIFKLYYVHDNLKKVLTHTYDFLNTLEIRDFKQ